MSQRVNTSGGRRRGLVWAVSAVIFVSASLYWEQAALLYVLSTLAVCGLLVVVAFSDLDRGDKESSESNLNEKAATAGGGGATAAPSPNRERRVTKRKRRDAA